MSQLPANYRSRTFRIQDSGRLYREAKHGGPGLDISKLKRYEPAMSETMGAFGLPSWGDLKRKVGKVFSPVFGKGSVRVKTPAEIRSAQDRHAANVISALKNLRDEANSALMIQDPAALSKRIHELRTAINKHAAPPNYPSDLIASIGQAKQEATDAVKKAANHLQSVTTAAATSISQQQQLQLKMQQGQLDPQTGNGGDKTDLMKYAPVAIIGAAALFFMKG